MAIDFFVMPLSRYLSGAFVTPTMRFAWDAGLPYTLVGTENREIPIGELFGGPDAEARRKEFLSPDMVPGDLARYPAPISQNLWDESSTVEPRYHRVDPASYAVLIEESRDRLVEKTTRRLFGLQKLRKTHRSHLASALFFPVEFDEPFLTESIFEGWMAGSVATALDELSEGAGTSATESARSTLRDALNDAMTLRLPLIVDC